MSNTVPIEVDRRALRRGESSVPQQAPRGTGSERHLRPVATGAGKARKASLSPLVGALVCVGIVLAILATQLGLSIAVSKGAYETRALEIEQRDLSRVERLLAQNVDKLASPQNLAQNATALGMVQNVNPATLRLSDGAILGSLDSKTSEARGNMIPNSTLEQMPVVDADGLLVDRNSGQAGAANETPKQAPVRWEGKLPAPNTH